MEIESFQCVAKTDMVKSTTKGNHQYMCFNRLLVCRSWPIIEMLAWTRPCISPTSSKISELDGLNLMSSFLCDLEPKTENINNKQSATMLSYKSLEL